MSIAAIGSYGTSAWEVQTRTAGSVEETQQSARTSGSVSIPQGTAQETDEYLPSQAMAEEAAATYKPPSPDKMSDASARTSDGSEGVNEEGASLQNASSDEEGTSISVQTSNDAADTESVAAASTPLASESTESTDSADTIGKPSWISDENWAAIQENPDQQPSDMSDEDWQAYLEWAGKSTSSDSQRQAVPSEQAAVTEGMPPGAAATTVTTERAESTTLETTTQSAQESGNRFNEYANRYSRWNSGNLNVGLENRINVTT